MTWFWVQLSAAAHILSISDTMPENCPNAKFFLVRIFMHSVPIQENKDQKTPSLDTFHAVTVYGEIVIKQLTLILTLYKKWSFPPRISSVNVTKSVVSCRFHFCQIYFKGALSLCCMKGSNALCLGLIQMRSKSNYFI